MQTTNPELFSNLAEVERLMGQGIRDALRDHKRTGDPVVTWRDGEVVWIPADEIDVPDIEDDAPAPAV